jgi:hypothetical protein
LGGGAEVLLRWFLFECRVGDWLLCLLERYGGLGVVEVEELEGGG